PALMKALLINGSRSVNDSYDFNIASSLNGQGWGLVTLTNSLGINETKDPDHVITGGTMVRYDQDAGRVLATGEEFTRVVTLASNARTAPLRFTVVWTDPPGNPAVGIKLVNDLDVVVTNLSTKEIYVGNTFGEGSLFNEVTSTNVDLVLDRVNNVENVYLRGSFEQPLSASYSVTVRARRLNVHA